MYLQNKYTTWYNSIINRAQNRELLGYSEKHHILPKSLGGSNNSNNLVRLTAREHFVCHLLLPKMLSGQNKAKMIHAAWALANLENDNQQRYTITNRIYESIKIQRTEILRETMLLNNPMNDPLVRAKHKASAQSRDKTKGMTGKKHSPETIAKMKKASLGQVVTEETRKKLSEFNKGRKHTAETRAKMAESQRIRHQKKNKLSVYD